MSKSTFDLIQRHIDPWRPTHVAPAEDGPATGERGRAQALREQYRREVEALSTVHVDGVAGVMLIFVAAILVVYGLLSPLWSVMALVAIFGAACVHVFRPALGPAARWAGAYRGMYQLLAYTSTPLLIATFRDVDSVPGHTSGSAKQHLIGSRARDLPAAFLRAARLPDRALLAWRLQEPAWWNRPLALPGWCGDERPLDIAVKARYCAIYDFFFNPQAVLE